MLSDDLNNLCSSGDLDQVQELLSSKLKLSQDELDTALDKATEEGHTEVVGVLLSQGARINDCVFHCATHGKNPAIFQKFLDHGWDINSTEFGNPALRLVVRDETCVRWFLEHGADPNRRGRRDATPLSTAALLPSTSVLELLLSHGAELDPEAMLSAISRRGQGGVPAMRVLIDHGMDVNARVKRYGSPAVYSPLAYAVHVAGVEQTRFLLERGADRWMKVMDTTPFEMAKEAMIEWRDEKVGSEDSMTVYELLSE